MKSYGTDFLGPLKIEQVATLPEWKLGDERRIIYVKDSGKMFYGNVSSWSEFSGSGGSEQDEYHDLLNSSVYNNCTWDDFSDATEALVDTGNSTATFDIANSQYNFTAGQVLQSDNLYDSEASMTAVTEALIHVNYSDTGTPSISATADGTNWESITNNRIHEFTNTGTTLKLKFTGGSTGSVESWGILYNPDTGSNIGANRRKYLTFYYEGACQDEDTIIDGFYFDNSVAIDQLTLYTRVAPTGSNLTVDLLSDGVEQSAVATLTDGSAYEETTVTTKYYTSNERFGMIIKSIGSGEAGQGLTVIVHYYDTL